jgi:tetratricopeptide (TPR) repeat protein
METPSPNAPLIRRPMYGVAAVVLLAYFTVQVLLWKEFAPQVTWLQMHRLVLDLSPKQLKEWGAICNSLQDWRCSERVFARLVNKDPSSKTGLANYGMSLAHQQKWAEAHKAFETYFLESGAAYDVMFWQAKTLARLGRNSEALEWYYKALSKRPHNAEIVLEAVDHLMLMARFGEALSVVASFTNGAPDKDPFWNSKVASIKEKMFDSKREVATVSEAPVETMRLPAIIGKNHFLPIHVGADAGFQFFIVDSESPVLTMPREVLQQLWQMNGLKSGVPLGSARRVQLPELVIGPWTLKDIDVVICQSCRPRLGRLALETLAMETFLEDQMEFLLISKK